MQETHPYTLSVFTENKIGLLLRITTVFTRRHINIESLTTSESEIPGIHRFVIVIRVTDDQVVKLKKQLDKIIGVIKAFVLREEEVVHQELAMYKISNEQLADSDFERIVRDNHARVLHFGADHIMLEKT
ncbi:MAG: acetolactate synthase small subunit [Bacteroidota bacterium]